MAVLRFLSTTSHDAKSRLRLYRELHAVMAAVRNTACLLCLSFERRRFAEARLHLI